MLEIGSFVRFFLLLLYIFDDLLKWRIAIFYKKALKFISIQKFSEKDLVLYCGCKMSQII